MGSGTVNHQGGPAVITDAGWDTLSYAEALRYFPEPEIRAWWTAHTEALELEHICEDLGIAVPAEDDEAQIEAIWEMLPSQISVITARACYQDQRWASVLSLPEDGFFSARFERQALLLGILLREALGLDIAVVNDNRGVVKALRPHYHRIHWTPKVNAAHKLTLRDAILIQPRTLIDALERALGVDRCSYL